MSATEPSDPAASLHHAHDHGIGVADHERRTRWVVGLTLVTMVGELVVGALTNSLALLADGWHMATHAGALGLSAAAYWFARTRADSGDFSFGTGKVHALAGYTSAVVLALVALLMVGESVRRLVSPESVAFAEALPVAVLGLLVNLISARLLHPRDHHHAGGAPAASRRGAGHEPSPSTDASVHLHHDAVAAAPETDHNLKAAYVHVLADALTSVLAILALIGGEHLGWGFLDPAMGIVGGLVIARWSYGLSRGAARQLLDVVHSPGLVEHLREHLERELPGTRVVDLHLWELGPGARACILSVVAAEPLTPTAYREWLLAHARLEHVTVEVHPLASLRGAAAEEA